MYRTFVEYPECQAGAAPILTNNIAEPMLILNHEDMMREGTNREREGTNRDGTFRDGTYRDYT